MGWNRKKIGLRSAVSGWRILFWSTLAGMLMSLRAQAARFLPDKPALCLILPAAGALLLSVCGLETLVGVVYPLLGWVCLLALLVLPFQAAAA